MTASTATMPAPTYAAALMRAIRSFALLRESWVGLVGCAAAVDMVGPEGLRTERSRRRMRKRRFVDREARDLSQTTPRPDS